MGRRKQCKVVDVKRVELMVLFLTRQFQQTVRRHLKCVGPKFKENTGELAKATPENLGKSWEDQEKTVTSRVVLVWFSMMVLFAMMWYLGKSPGQSEPLMILELPRG